MNEDTNLQISTQPPLVIPDVSRSYNLFGEEYNEKLPLSARYKIAPFTIINKLDNNYKRINQQYYRMPCNFGNGRDGVYVSGTQRYGSCYSGKQNKTKKDPHLSVFEPALCDILMNWFAPINGNILDPFAGGLTRGLCAAKNGYNYTGIDIRENQILSNYEEFEKSGLQKKPNWIIGDSLIKIEELQKEYDCIFTCPPYHDMEKYSDDPNDISNMNYNDFIDIYEKIINKSCDKTKDNAFAVFVISDFRIVNNRNYFLELRNFVGKTIDIFKNNGFELYNKGVIVGHIGSAGMRADKNFTYRKLTKIHEELLVFYKGDMFDIPRLFNCG